MKEMLSELDDGDSDVPPFLPRLLKLRTSAQEHARAEERQELVRIRRHSSDAAVSRRRVGPGEHGFRARHGTDEPHQGTPSARPWARTAGPRRDGGSKAENREQEGNT
ncbi:MAG TPA: hypothetical protein VN520_38635 [Streptomyces sp.]|uniref:hypothetical protein n=1 Tax=Streptomyces sp. TaxID=1931 RepID=UPI002C321C31|nr:hypothetical protein [Streptomyces sp.]HWU12199.1 hypothetical protein [Streptomyces sp.]